MIDWILNIDKELFLFFNGMNNSFFDFIMYWISSKSLWIPLYLFFAYILYKVYDRGFWLPLISLILIVGLADFISVQLFKNVFERLRPCHSEELQGLVHIVKGKCGGSYGFVSSHAANMFSLATAFWLFIKDKYPKTLIWLLLWAGIIGYSRIYLGVHYPGDVLGGAIVGMLTGLIGYMLYSKLPCSNNSISKSCHK